MIPVIMPQVGQDVPTGKIVEWRKRENDTVEKGEIILVVESEKAAFEVEAEQSGILLRILHGEGEEVGVLEPLAYIGQPGERWGERAESAKGAGVTGKAMVPAPERRQRAIAPSGAEPERVVASPSARRAAGETGVDLRSVKGSGPDGRITKKDVLATASSSVATAAADAVQREPGPLTEDKVVTFDRMRKVMAERLTRSAQTIPHFYIVVDADVTEMLKWREAFNRGRDTKVTITDLAIKACALALRTCPRMNAHVDAEKVVLKGAVHIGVATSVENGLLVPVIPHADQKTLIEISRTSRENAEAARRGFLASDQVGTFTISSLGKGSVREFLPIINPPECGILAVGSIEKRAVVREGVVAVRDVMTLTLGCDHRAADGVYAARFLNQVKDFLEKGLSEGESDSRTQESR